MLVYCRDATKSVLEDTEEEEGDGERVVGGDARGDVGRVPLATGETIPLPNTSSEIPFDLEGEGTGAGADIGARGIGAVATKAVSPGFLTGCSTRVGGGEATACLL